MSERQTTADSPSRWVHSLHPYHFRNWQDRAANRAPSVRSSTSGNTSTTSSFVCSEPRISQSKQLGHIFDDIDWGTYRTRVVRDTDVVALSKPWFRSHNGKAICKLCAPVRSIREQTCEDGGSCSGRRPSAIPAAASPQGWPCSSSCPEK